jgi:hypothetical protein
MNFLLPLAYTILFSWLILKLPFYKNSGLKPALRLSLFWIKILAGILVLFVYTHFYKNPTTADVLLYYSDGKILYNSIFTNPADFFKMLFGIGCDTEYFNETYFTKMERWQRFHDSLFFNDSRTIIRFNAFCDLFAFGAMHVNTVIMCFLSFTGLTAFYKTFRKYFRGKQSLLVFAVFLPPALLFWSSGILKEGILMFALGFFIYFLFLIVIEKKIKAATILFFLLSLFLFLINKVYILFTLLPPLISFLLFTKVNFRFKWAGFLIVNCLMIASGLFVSKKALDKDFVKELIDRQRDFINVARGGIYLVRDTVIIRMEYADKKQLEFTEKKDTVRINPGSHYEYWLNEQLYDTLRRANSKPDSTGYRLNAEIEPARSAYYMPHLRPGFSSFLSYAPRAFLNVLFRPIFTEAENLYQKISSAENIFYLLLFVFCLLAGDYKKANWAVFWLGIFFALNLFLLIGFTTPVAGALVRYKAPALPFLLMSAFSLLDVEKLKRIPLLKKLAAK